MVGLADDGARLDLCPPDVAAEIAAVRRRSTDEDGRFPLRLIIRRTRGAMNGAFRRATKVTRHMPYNPLHLSPRLMAELGIRDGDAVTLESRSGSVLSVPVQTTR